MTKGTRSKTKKPERPEETERIQKATIRQKGPIKYEIELNEEQKAAKRLVLENQITILTGKAGSGKTIVAVITALDMLFKKEIKKIFITRPVVTREEIGFLPGNIADKMDPFLVPIYDNLNKVYRDTDVINKLIEDKSIDIAPIAYIRGRTIDNAVLIVDEAQNIDDESCEALLTRTGKTGKVIVCGDSRQIDLKTKVLSGLNLLVRMSDSIDGIAYLDLKKNHRSPLVEKIITFYEEVRTDREKIKFEKEADKRKDYLKG